jgi:hypothetical protein
MPVTTYVVDFDGFADFLAGRTVPIYSGFKARHNHSDRFRLGYTGKWYLIIQNMRSNSVEVEYNVYT